VHIILILVGIAAVVFLILQLSKQYNASQSVPNSQVHESNPWNSGSTFSLAYLANGKLYYQVPTTGIEQLQSPYVQEMHDKLERHQERHAWKENTSFSVSANGGLRQFQKDEAQILATSMQFVDRDNVLYFLRDALMGGLFSMNLKTGEEKRILHKQNLALSDLNLDDSSSRILCTSKCKDGSSNIAIINMDGSQFQSLTGGDTLDGAPAWIPGAEAKILYQSAGLARAANGYIAAIGSTSIQMLDLASSRVTSVLEDTQFDYLHPRVCPQGSLHFIRRPYEGQKNDTASFLLDTLLFPFRLLRAVFHYLNFFSMMYSRKPLTSANGPAVQADLKEIILKGKRIDAEKAMRNAGAVQGVPSLVPSSWQLISRDRQGNEQVLATNVLAYDIHSDGSIIYTNGRGVFLLERGRTTRLIMKADLIEELVTGAAKLPA
jgi:hypothetical protein